MTNSKTTKGALLASGISLLLCFAMLLGTTFAWFTDSVTSANNIIKAGNLDIEVEYTLDGENWKNLDGASDLFQKGLWEPGHTEVVALKIANKGSLALKYAANMNIVSEKVGTNRENGDIVLSDILNVSTLTQQANDVGEIALALAFMGENRVAYEKSSAFKVANVLKNEQELFPGDAHYLFVKVDMPETVGNEANAIDEDRAPSIDFGINVVATQFTYEGDSYDNQYDKDAECDTIVSTDEELKTAVADGATNILLRDGEYNVANCGGKTLTISGSKNAVLKLYNEGEDGCDYGFDGSTVTFNGITIDTTANTGNYKGYARMTATFNDCNFVGGGYTTFKEQTFNNCTFDIAGYIWTWGATKVSFDKCTFVGDSRAILAHGSASTVITIKDCDFAATSHGNTWSGDWVAAVEIDPTGTNTYTINFTGDNTLSENYSGWTRVKDDSTGHTITGLN